MKKIIQPLFVISILIISSMSLYAQAIREDSLYLGQTPPGNTPQIFAPGFISLNSRLETYPTFSPDGKEMFFSVVNANWSTGKILHARERNGTLTIPDTAFFSKNNYKNWESFISPDGSKQIFASNRPPSSNMDIWMIERTSDTTWSNPVHLNNPVNSNAEDGSACITNNGTLYFKSTRGGGIGGSMLYRAMPVDSSYPQVQNLGDIIHTVSGESEPFMAPDESYLIFISQTRSRGFGGWDLWICFRNNDNSWSLPVNMGPTINTRKDEYGPRVTPDGKYLFFTRETRGQDMDIYWVSASIIDSLRHVIPSDSLYFGQTPPDNTPIVFAPGFISLTNRRETKIVFSPANDECMIGIGESGTFKILYSKYDNDFWSVPEPANFITNTRTIEPFFSPDGQQIFFTSYADIYVSNKENQTWSTPIKLGSPINTPTEEYHPTVTLNRTLYFCSMRDNSCGDIYRSVFQNGNYSIVEKLDKVINKPYHAWDPFIAPDESYIIFTSIYPDGFGNEDQYISYNKNGRWTYPKNLGPKINTNKIEYGSYISLDNKYYFFSRPNGWGPNIPADIYWVSASFIDSLKYTNFIPYLNYQIPDQSIQTGQVFNYTIPDSTFIDDDGNNTLTYLAILSNGNPLPTWLSFEPATKTFSGTPTDVININVKVKATDSANASVTCTFAINVTITGIEETKNQIPESINLCQNYPNPFNPTTTIEFAIPKTGRYKLGLYNSIGELVREISDREYEAGYYKETLNAAGLSNGMYLYRLTGNDANIVRKMVLLR